MALKEIATEARVITITPTGAATWTPGEPVWDEHPSDKVKDSGGQKILVTRISWSYLTVLGSCTKPLWTQTSGGALNPIGPTIAKVHETNLPGWMGEPLAKGDKGKCTGVFTRGILPPTFCTCDFEITDAGQIKAKGQ